MLLAPTMNGIMIFSNSPLVSLDLENQNLQPTQMALHHNYPNSFNPTTTIRFDLPRSSFVTLKIFDILGREITTLVNESRSPGAYTAEWNGKDFASGIYFYRIEAGDYKETRKLVLQK